MKRSRYVALFSMGASALALAACEDPNALVPVKAYETVAACVADGFSQSQCTTAFVTAENSYESTYPKYESQAECEVNAGPENCELDHPSSRSANWRPSMIGFLMGAAIGSRAQPQPIVSNASSPTGRATATGFPVAGRGSNATIPSRLASTPTAAQVGKAHTLSRGGFGGTASKIATSAPSASHGHSFGG
ncbi:MAG: DUF1190 domain-containing protein [Hyphomicrobiaceae bacterium]